jgi:23S rRNA (uracil1939-C5)-methyltransferase
MEPTTIEQPRYGGDFTSSAGAVLPFVLPGEEVEVAPELLILQASPDRVVPGCVHFGACGGCHYQQAAYPAQLQIKRAILADLLAAAQLEIPAIHTESGPAWHYRNRIRLRIEQSPAGGFRAGYSRRASNAFLPIAMCPIAAPLLWRAAHAILQLSERDTLVRRWLAITSELELFCAPDEARLQLQFFLRSGEAAKRESSSFAGFCERVRATVPELSGAGATLDPELNRRARRIWAGTAWGADGLLYPVAGREYWLARGAFFQVNRFLVGRLVERVIAGAQGELAWDLYAGVGLFSRALAESFAEVVAVEGAEAAVSSLNAAARATKTLHPVHSPTLDFLRTRSLERERPSLIVLDPPRAGIGLEAANLLNRIGAPELVYVSCDPTTLARDLNVLREKYRIASVCLIDLFPQTFHMETVVHLRLDR